MSWVDIELKWAAMARRIGADCTLLDEKTEIARAPLVPPMLNKPSEMLVQALLERSEA
jgi:hypothetical protein